MRNINAMTGPRSEAIWTDRGASFGGFCTRLKSLPIRYHIKARSVNRLFSLFMLEMTHAPVNKGSRSETTQAIASRDPSRRWRLCEKFLK